MTEEEKEATENLKKLVQQRKDKTNTITIKYDSCICSTKELDIAVNLIQRQETENMKLKQENEIQGDNYKGLIADVSGISKELGLEEDATIDEIYTAIRILKSKRVNMFEKLDCIEKKDKIIDILAEKLAKQYNSKPRKCSFKEQKNIECNNYENCVDCIKQYFENKVESEDKQ